MINLDSILKSRTLLCQQRWSSQGYGFSNGHVWMWELDCEEDWALKDWCFWTVVLEKTLESTLDCKEIQQAHPKGDQSWVFIGRTDVDFETPKLGSRYEKSWLLKRFWCWEKLKAGGEGYNRGWDGWMASPTQWTWVCVNSRNGQGSLTCCGSWGRKESDTTERLNWTRELSPVSITQLKEKQTWVDHSPTVATVVC